MANFTIKQATRDRCKIYKITPQLLEKFTPVSLELYPYLYEIPKVDFSIFFKLDNEMIEYMKADELSEDYLDHIYYASQKHSDKLDICILKRDRPKLNNVISHIRNKKINNLIIQDPSLDKQTLQIFGNISGASQMIVRGGIDTKVAQKVSAEATRMVDTLMDSDLAMGTLSRMITIDPTLYDHSAAVAMFSSLMATRFRDKPLSSKEAAIVAQCGLFHDTGKSCVPSHVLNKPGPFTDDEYEIIKQHTHLGCAELQKAQAGGAPIDDIVCRVALEHHERFTGGGYPFKKSGRFEDDPENGIHIYSRFVAIADAYSALLMKRVYKPALSSEDSISLMSKNAKNDFDMDIFESFIGTISGSLKKLKDENEYKLDGIHVKDDVEGTTIDYTNLVKKII